jgi:hypothetical protein
MERRSKNLRFQLVSYSKEKNNSPLHDHLSQMKAGHEHSIVISLLCVLLVPNIHELKGMSFVEMWFLSFLSLHNACLNALGLP